MNKRLLLNILRPVCLGLVYGYLETVLRVSIPEYIYRPIYIALLVLPFVNLNYYIWLGDGVLAMFIQDLSYWIFKHELPWPWSWYYPVWNHVPLLYFPAIFIIIYAYHKGSKKTIYIPIFK